MPEVNQLGGGIEAQADALQAGHVGVPGAKPVRRVMKGRGAAGTEASWQPGPMAAGRNYSVSQTFLPNDGS